MRSNVGGGCINTLLSQVCLSSFNSLLLMLLYKKGYLFDRRRPQKVNLVSGCGGGGRRYSTKFGI